MCIFLRVSRYWKISVRSLQYVLSIMLTDWTYDCDANCTQPLQQVMTVILNGQWIGEGKGGEGREGRGYGCGRGEGGCCGCWWRCSEFSTRVCKTVIDGPGNGCLAQRSFSNFLVCLMVRGVLLLLLDLNWSVSTAGFFISVFLFLR